MCELLYSDNGTLPILVSIFLFSFLFFREFYFLFLIFSHEKNEIDSIEIMNGNK